MAKKPAWDTVVIVGVGLMGGSLGKAILERKLARRIIGVGRNAERLKKGVKLGAITEYSTELESAAAAADLLILCTPVEEIPKQITAVRRVCKPSTVITDVGSTKATIVAAATYQYRSRIDQPIQGAFVGSHPIAGSEKTGVEHANANLFSGKVCIVTPSPHESAAATREVEKLWKSVGMLVELMEPRAHDDAMAAVSHLPHVMASLLSAEIPAKLQKFAGSGLKDTTRVAAGDVELWRQILTENRLAVSQLLHSLIVRMTVFQKALGTNDQEAIVRQLDAGKKNRDALGN